MTINNCCPKCGKKQFTPKELSNFLENRLCDACYFDFMTHSSKPPVVDYDDGYDY